MQSSVSQRLGAICGVAFALLVFLAVASLETPKKASDQEIIDWWSKSGNQATAVASMFLMAAGGIAFAIFSSSLRERLSTAGSELAHAVGALSAGATALLLVAAGLRGSIGMAVRVNDEPLPGVAVLRLVPELSRNTVDIACLVLAVTTLLTGWAVLRAGGLPRWVGWSSVVLGGLSLVLLPVVGPFVLPLELLWAVAASVALWRDPKPEPLAGAAVIRTASAS